MIQNPRRPAPAMLLALSLGALLLTACGGDDSLKYQDDYANHQPLRVTGYPSAGSLGTVQQIIWHLADQDADALAALNTEDSDADSAARAWIKAYAEDARGKVTADFLNEGSVRQDVVLHFTASHRTQELTVRIAGDTWGVVLDTPSPTPESR